MAKSISNEQAMAMAEYWLSRLTTGNTPVTLASFSRDILTNKDLQRAVGVTFSKGQITQKTVSERIKEMFKDNYLTIKRNEDLNPPKKDPVLSAKLLDRFRSTSVGEFIVCDTDRLPKGTDRAMAVGHLAGQHLLEKVNFFQDNDRIGVG